jgi:TonB family protein
MKYPLLFRSLLSLCVIVAVQLTHAKPKSDVESIPSPRTSNNPAASNPTGEGEIVLDVDYDTGRVTKAHLVRSTGRQGIDLNALDQVRRWQFKPKSFTHIKVPIAWEGELEESAVEKYIAPKPHQDRLILYAPTPRYPMAILRTYGGGHYRHHGRYELTVRSDGTVANVKVLQTADDARLDQSVVSALSVWRFRPGAFTTLMIPISFDYNGGYYKIEVR